MSAQTLESRIAHIDKHAEFVRRKEWETQLAAENKRLELKNRVKALNSEISEMIDLANKLIDVGINVYDTKARYYDMRKYDFYSEGVNHKVGFMKEPCGMVSYVGIVMGGGCGPYDFVTDGVNVFKVREYKGQYIDDMKWEEPTTEMLIKFLDGWGDFVQNFTSFIDNLEV